MPPVLAYAPVPEVDLLAAYDEHCGRLISVRETTRKYAK
jgi:hypothetical protein